MRVVIVGAQGWAARASEHLLVSQLKIQSKMINLYGRVENPLYECNGRTYRVSNWSQNNRDKPTLFLPFAFATADKFVSLGREKFNETNRNLIDSYEKYIAANHPQYCLLLSSGIARSQREIAQRTEGYRLYANFKIEEEERIRDACSKAGTKLLVATLYSASGEHMVDPKKYAIGNFIFQAIQSGSINVKSDILVYRRYVDMSQFLEVCLEMLFHSSISDIESGGFVIELHDLAKLIAEEYNCDISQNVLNGNKADRYYAYSNDFDNNAEKLGIKLYDLKKQIHHTAKAVSMIINNEQKM